MSLRNLVLGVVSAAMLTACAQQETTDTTDTTDTPVTPAFDAEAFRTQVGQFVTTWNTGGGSALGTMIAEDAVLMQPDGPAIEGRTAILTALAEGYDIALLQQVATVDEVLAVGDLAYGRGTWTLNPTAAAGDLASLSGQWSALYQPGPDGQWQIWRWMWNQPSPQVLDAQ
jgi:ketosteroid isomerase-like protein